MNFYENQLFHIYNQGNNKRQLFFSDDNYQFFLWKMRANLLPFGDIVAWCLMPNHFHWLFYVRRVTVSREDFRKFVDDIEFQRRQQKYKQAKPVNKFHQRSADKDKPITLGEAIGILQKSYAKALNKEKGWSGSLFRKNCKAKDGWVDDFITVQKNGKDDFRFLPGTEYAHTCFCYIHQNPVVANIVKEESDYNWSSAKEYSGQRKGTLCNIELGNFLGLYSG